jgi:hypothetical protein
MRTFTLGPATDRKVVVIEVDGPRMRVSQIKPDGTTKRSEKELPSEAEARTACEKMAQELAARGYVERPPSGTLKTRNAKPARPAPAAAKPAARAPEPEKSNLPLMLREDEAADPVLPRLADAPAARAADGAPKKKKKAGGKKKKKMKAGSGDALDKRVLAGIGAVGVVCVALLGYMAYDAFLKPPTIVGTWAGSMIDFEIGKPIIHSEYRLVLDENHRAALTLQEKFTSVGTYTVNGDRLKLTLKEQLDEKDKGEEGEEGSSSEREYKIKLGRATLDLYDPSTGKQMVQLIRFREPPVVGGAGAGAPGAAPKGLVVGDVNKADKAAEDSMVSVAFSPKDNAFKLRHPKGWEAETGSRPDNTYSWATFTQGSAKVQVFADVTGSLMSGAPADGQYEEGSELAPVHRAHEQYRKTISEEFSDYQEGKPSLFKGAGLGEGRIAVFTASGGGLFGSKVRGYRVTLLTNDRRVTVLSQCPEADFGKYKPTFLALSRSLSR